MSPFGQVSLRFVGSYCDPAAAVMDDLVANTPRTAAAGSVASCGDGCQLTGRLREGAAAPARSKFKSGVAASTAGGVVVRAEDPKRKRPIRPD
jgi:hypothetical protein